jgi:hypothetical protein
MSDVFPERKLKQSTGYTGRGLSSRQAWDAYVAEEAAPVVEEPVVEEPVVEEPQGVNAERGLGPRATVGPVSPFDAGRKVEAHSKPAVVKPVGRTTVPKTKKER